ncbi:MAG: extracellular solute-binding protein [Oscillospiraceae bacterium]|nr:extracellular solute-binding protein [Oscillospiraceae bacterium]
MKKAIIMVLVISMLSGISTASTTAFLGAAADAAGFQPGDVNMDGDVTITDARLILQSLVGKILLTDEQKKLADVDLCGKAAISDARMVLQFIVGKISTLSLAPEPVDLGGYEFVLADYWPHRWGRPYWGDYSIQMGEALDAVAEAYNCTITIRDDSVDTVYNDMRSEVLAGLKYADAVCTTQWNSGKIAEAGLALDLNTLPVNWNAYWWDQDLRGATVINRKNYIGGGVLAPITNLASTLYFNQRIWNELSLPDPYKMAAEGGWTLDRFAEYAKRARGDGSDNRWGAVGPQKELVYALYFGSDNTFITGRSGNPALSCDNAAAYATAGRLGDIFTEDKSVYTQTADNAAMKQMFLDGRSLFLYGAPDDAKSMWEMGDAFGMLPMPKRDAKQDGYRSLLDHNAAVFMVPAIVNEPAKTAAVIEGLAYALRNSEQWHAEAYAWQAPHFDENNRQMLELIDAGRKTDFSLIFKNTPFQYPAQILYSSVRYQSEFEQTLSEVAAWCRDELNAWAKEMAAK